MGQGEDSEKARLPVYVGSEGHCSRVFGYSAFHTRDISFFADRPDVAYADINRIGDEIRNARDNCDFLIVSFHWGREFDFYPYDHQRELAYLAADSGADVVVGHHPHVLQGIEEYNGSRIFYSLGNFVFDWQVPTGTDETVIVGLTLSGGSIREVELIPVQIKDCQPVLAQGDKAERILGRLQSRIKETAESSFKKRDESRVLYEQSLPDKQKETRYLPINTFVFDERICELHAIYWRLE